MEGTITYCTMMITVCSCIMVWFQGCCMQCPEAVGWAQVLLCRVLFHCEVSHHGTSVKVQITMMYNKMCGWYIILCQFLDNSDSPSIVEQWSQKAWCSIITSLWIFLLSIPDVINLLWHIYYFQNSTHPRCLYLIILGS